MSFALHPHISTCATFAEFAKSSAIGSRDLIFTQRFLHDAFMSGTPAQTLFYDDFCGGEPNDAAVDAMLKAARRLSYDRLIAIGGGSILDCAKILALDSQDDVAALYALENQPGRKVGLVLVPTTCGTGCEVTCVSVLDFPKLGSKIGKRFNAGFADQAVLVSGLLSKLPYEVFATSSVDALIHALEIYLAPSANAYTDLFCIGASRSILEGYVRIRRDGRDVIYADMERYLVASNMAGIALANVLAGGVHAVAMHFGSAHHLAHGEATRLFLASVFHAYVEKAPNGKIADLTALIGQVLGVESDGMRAIDALDALLAEVAPAKRLTDYGMSPGDAPAYAQKVIATQQRLLVNCYVPLSSRDIEQVYERLL